MHPENETGQFAIASALFRITIRSHFQNAASNSKLDENRSQQGSVALRHLHRNSPEFVISCTEHNQPDIFNSQSPNPGN